MVRKVAESLFGGITDGNLEDMITKSGSVLGGFKPRLEDHKMEEDFIWDRRR